MQKSRRVLRRGASVLTLAVLAVGLALTQSGGWVGATSTLATPTSLGSTTEEQVIAAYEAASPSVINITSVAYVRDWFLGSVPQEGTGSGFLFDTQGHVVTNNHVIEGADELVVTLANGQSYAASVIGRDPSNDLAVVRVVTDELLPPPLRLADTSGLRVGQFVLAIGSPFGLQQTLTTGVVSALERVIESSEAGDFIGEAIQTDAAINPGNSGGPLLNLDGEVIGVNCQILSTSGSSAGIGFAISARTVARVVPELIAHGSYPHPWLGIRTLDLTAYTAQVLRSAGATLAAETGVLVLGFEEGSPAQAAGLRAGGRQVRLGRYILPVGGDVIVAVDEQAVKAMQDLTVYLETKTKVNDHVSITFLRDGAEREAQVTLAARPES